MLYPTNKQGDITYDVIICGGGLAGQTLARQLKLKFPDITILMIVKTTFPLSAVDFKVGESTVEISSFYFKEVLQLHDYFKNQHYKKFGFRYFTGDSTQCLSKRPEIGLSHYAPYDSFQIDRSIFENDLYKMNLLAGVKIIEGSSVHDIILTEDRTPHTVIYKDADEVEHAVKAQWVMDASGRRCLIQRKLNLKVKPNGAFSSIWFRVKGRLDIDNFVPLTEEEYHNRLPFGLRYFATNHLIGKGYWVWLIPLSSYNTSVGIVTSEEVHPFSDYLNMEKAIEWLKKYEPVVAKHLEGFEVLDFGKMRNYSYSSRQMFSVNRWACVGEAAVFSDPFYSPGSNLIAFDNSIATKMIELDFQGRLQADYVQDFNNFAIGLNDWLTETIHSSYSYFGEPIIMALSYLWDVVCGWAFMCPNMFNSIYLDVDKKNSAKQITDRFFPLAVAMEKTFNQWKLITPRKYTFHFIDYLSIPFVKKIYDRNVQSNKSEKQLYEDFTYNLDVIEEFAQVIFLLAVEDTMPEKLELFKEPAWINAWAIGLEPEKWEADGLFRPESKPRDLSVLMNQLKPAFKLAKMGVPEKSLEASFDFKF